MHHRRRAELARRLHQSRQVFGRRRAAHATGPEAERREHGLEPGELARVGRLVHAVQGRPARVDQQLGHRPVGGEHRLLDGAMRERAHAAPDRDHAPRGVHDGLGLDEVEVERAARDAPLAQQPRCLRERAQRGAQRGVGVAASLHPFGRLLVGEFARGCGPGPAPPAGAAARRPLPRELDRECETVLFGTQRAEVARERLGQHRDHALGQVHAVAARARLAVERRAGRHVVRDVRDRDPEPEAVALTLREHGVVVIAGAQRVDGDEREMAQVQPRVGARIRRGQRLELTQARRGEASLERVQVAERLEIELRIADASEALLGNHAPAPLEAQRDHVPRREIAAPAQRGAQRAVVGMAAQLEPARRRTHHAARGAAPRLTLRTTLRVARALPSALLS